MAYGNIRLQLLELYERRHFPVLGLSWPALKGTTPLQNLFFKTESNLAMEMKDIQTILQMLKQNEIHEFELEHEGTKNKIARGQVVTTVVAQPAVSAAPIQPAISSSVTIPANADAKGGVQVNSNAKKVESPIVGTFYRKPSPDAEPFVKEGDRVKKGATLCIIEAMKVMNEIDAPCDGVVEKILPAEGEVVEFGEILFLIAQ